MYLKTVIEIDCNIQITFMYVCSMYCTVYATWDMPSLLYFNKEYVTCNSNENMIAFAPSPPTILSVCTIYSEWVGARTHAHLKCRIATLFQLVVRNHLFSAIYFYGKTESANFIRYHNISINSRSKPSSTNCAPFSHCCWLLLFPMGVLQTKTDILFKFFSCMCVCVFKYLNRVIGVSKIQLYV